MHLLGWDRVSEYFYYRISTLPDYQSAGTTTPNRYRATYTREPGEHGKLANQQTRQTKPANQYITLKKTTTKKKIIKKKPI